MQPKSARGASAARLVYECVIDGNEEICSIPAGGGITVRLTKDPASDRHPRFSADGRKALFSSNRSGEWQIYETDITGGSLRRARTSADRDWQADPSPDGRRIVFISDNGGEQGLWIQTLDQHKERPLARFKRRTVLGNPDWGPQGGAVVFSSNHSFGHQIYRIDVATSEVVRVSPVTNGGCEPRFSPDGKKVVYVTRRHLKTTSQIIEHDLDTGKERVVVGWPALNYDPVYSPDSSELAFASTIAGEMAIYRQRFSDGRSWRVTFGAGSARHPDYAPAR